MNRKIQVGLLTAKIIQVFQSCFSEKLDFSDCWNFQAVLKKVLISALQIFPHASFIASTPLYIPIISKFLHIKQQKFKSLKRTEKNFPNDFSHYQHQTENFLRKTMQLEIFRFPLMRKNFQIMCVCESFACFLIKFSMNVKLCSNNYSLLPLINRLVSLFWLTVKFSAEKSRKKILEFLMKKYSRSQICFAIAL